MKYDLHMHSTASDGKLDPRELVDWAERKGLEGIAITDHEVVNGSREAVKYAKGRGVEVVPGIEIGADDEGSGLYDVHIVGLFLDLENRGLLELSEWLMEARKIQKVEMIERLNDLGYEISFDELKKEVGGVNYGRPHVARILMRKYSEFGKMQDVFDELLGVSGRAYVKQERDTVRGTINTIHGAGGLAILAHPMLYRNADEIVSGFVEAGGDGIEVDYFYEGRNVNRDDAFEKISRAREIARERGLVISGGGDFHSREDLHEIGDYGATKEEFKKMRKYWENRS